MAKFRNISASDHLQCLSIFALEISKYVFQVILIQFLLIFTKSEIFQQIIL
jgi:hypothetical protein